MNAKVQRADLQKLRQMIDAKCAKSWRVEYARSPVSEANPERESKASYPPDTFFSKGIYIYIYI